MGDDGPGDGGALVERTPPGARVVGQCGWSRVLKHEGSADSDFRVESDNTANALFIEGGSGEVMFGKNIIDVATVGAGIRGDYGRDFFLYINWQYSSCL